MKLRIVAAVLLAVFAGAPGLAQTRQQTIRERSAHVMPFSMDATMHQFRQTPTGGVMTVIAHNGAATQVALVRTHLRKEAAAFARGDYADPAYIHGKNMPGLAALSAGSKRISVRYDTVADGASIAFRTTDTSLIAALHQWFAAQVSDHGHDAMM